MPACQLFYDFSCEKDYQSSLRVTFSLHVNVAPVRSVTYLSNGKSYTGDISVYQFRYSKEHLLDRPVFALGFSSLISSNPCSTVRNGWIRINYHDVLLFVNNCIFSLFPNIRPSLVVRFTKNMRFTPHPETTATVHRFEVIQVEFINHNQIRSVGRS